MWVLGICSSHNGAVALLRDGRVQVAIQAERLSRRKREMTPVLKPNAVVQDCIRYCLDYCGIGIGDLDAVATSTPWKEVGLNLDVLFQGMGMRDLARIRSVTVPHHLSHAEYAIHYADTDNALVLVIDGSGTSESTRSALTIKEVEDRPLKFVQPDQKETISAYTYDGAALRLIYRSAFSKTPGVGADNHQQSIGRLWEWASMYTFRDDSEAGKVMGLAGFGDAKVHRDLRVMSLDGEGRLDLRFDRLYENFRKPWDRQGDVMDDRHYADLAAHVQECTNTVLLDLCRLLRDRSGMRDMCYAGGVALNGLANEHVIRAGVFDNVFQNGSCEDNGTAIGAALAAHHLLTGQRVPEPVTDHYGRIYGDDEIRSCLDRYGLRYQAPGRAGMIADAAQAIAGGAVVGWFQGRSEFGPRALGNRSILADARSDAIKPVLDRKVKKREPYRPYAPAVIEEKAQEYFDLEGTSPVMIRVGRARDERLPAVTHVDGTARVQTVSRTANERFYDLIAAVGARTGVPVVLNTSFNVAGEPIVEAPSDAVRTFLYSGMDRLYLGDFIVSR